MKRPKIRWKELIDILPNKKTKLTAALMVGANIARFLGVDLPEEVVKFVNDVGIPALAFFLWMKIDRENGGSNSLSSRRW
jgi:hypothetical protein